MGGGIAGITAALGLGCQGYETYLVEKTDELGGVMRRIQHLDTAEDPQKYLKEKKNQSRNNNPE